MHLGIYKTPYNVTVPDTRHPPQYGRTFLHLQGGFYKKKIASMIPTQFPTAKFSRPSSKVSGTDSTQTDLHRSCAFTVHKTYTNMEA